MTKTWGGSAIGGDIVLELTPSFKNKKIGCYFYK
jgi:hypothetical protein